MIWTHAAAAIFAAALAFWGGWSTQGWRLGEQIAHIKAAQAEAINTATREARAQESARFKGVQDAQTAAQTRAQAARADADRARTELERLRDQPAASRGGVPGESPSACAVRADASADVLGQCAAAYPDLAAIADRHASDARTLIEAWPKYRAMDPDKPLGRWRGTAFIIRCHLASSWALTRMTLGSLRRLWFARW